MKTSIIHVSGAIIIHDNKIFCTQRNETGILPLKWEFPGGKIEPGETPHQALQRELIEELDLTVNMYNDIYMEVRHEYDFGIVNLSTIICRLNNTKPILKEHHNAKWVLPNELLMLDWAPADIPIVNQLAQESLEAL